MKTKPAINLITGILGTLGALAFSIPASAMPLATINTGGCVTSVTPGSLTCNQYGAADIFSHASLNDLTATARIDVHGPYSFTAQATVTYYMELLSSTGSFPNDYFFSVPLIFSANGYTETGGTAPVTGGFNHNRADATVRLSGGFNWSGCSGYGCWTGAQPSFGGVYRIDLRPSSYGYGDNVYQIQVNASASTNSNYATSYAYAWADPTIQIDPTFLAAHPEYSLAFSANLPQVPVPAAAWLFGSGLLGLIGVARRSA